MPAPVTKKEDSVEISKDLTHKVVLVNGKQFTVLDPNRPGSPWVFKEGVPAKVPAYIAKRLNASAHDTVTVKVGTKITSQRTAKFQIERIGDSPATAEDATE